MNYYYNRNDIIFALKKIGIKKNDKIFVSTSLGMMGRLSRVKKIKDLNNIYFSILKKMVGINGTILVPTYSYSFGLNEVFDVLKTKSRIGSFSNFFLKQKKIIRSHDPMISIAGIGKDAKEILKIYSNTSYGKNCIFENLLKYKIKILNLGLGPNWIPFIHYLDYLNNVPFRYDKYFIGFKIFKKEKIKIKWHYPVRLKKPESRANGHIIGLAAEKKKIFRYFNVGRSRFYCADYKKLFVFSKKISKKNIYITSYYEKN